MLSVKSTIMLHPRDIFSIILTNKYLMNLYLDKIDKLLTVFANTTRII